MKSKITSSIVAISYLAISYHAGGWELSWRVAIFLILPLACIWFSDAMGSYTGIGFGRGAITSTTPGCVVAFGGWLLLFIPVIATAIMILSKLSETQ